MPSIPQRRAIADQTDGGSPVTSEEIARLPPFPLLAGDDAGSSGDGRQLGEPSPADGERRCPGPGPHHAQVVTSGVAGHTGRQAAEAHTHGFGATFAKSLLSCRRQQPEPGWEIGREVRGEHPSPIDVP